MTIGREFAGIILESPPELQYEFPVGKKIIGYCMPWQVGCMAEVVGLPAMQCATMPDGLSYTEAQGSTDRIIEAVQSAVQSAVRFADLAVCGSLLKPLPSHSLGTF